MIEKVEVVKGAIPPTATVPKQQWIDEWSTQLYVKVTASDLTGWGEVLPAGANSREPYAALLRRMTPALVSEDESDTNALWTALRRLTFTGGYGITTGAISGIDIALWDIKARKAKKPLVSLLGGDPHPVRRYASMSRYARIEDAVRAVGWLLAKGYHSIKLHQSKRDAIETIRLVRKEYGGSFELKADLNCAFDYVAAREFMKSVGRYELKWVEEPVWPPDDFDSLRRLNGIGPVAAGENFFSYFEFKRLMEIDALSYYQPDIAKIGGITPALKLIALARRHGAKIAFHNRPDNGWVSTVTSAHLASAQVRKAVVETPPNEVPKRYFKCDGLVERNTITPGGVGIGIEPLPSIPLSEESRMLRFHES
jgi:L-alanine-DL-glutamate epimerase-like enolase superfamily enzyme